MNEDFCVVPAFGVIPSQTVGRGLFTGEIEGLEIDPTKVHSKSVCLFQIICCNCCTYSEGGLAMLQQ